MPAKSARQRRAAGADLARVRAGKKPRTFKGANQKQIEDFARKPAKRKK